MIMMRSQKIQIISNIVRSFPILPINQADPCASGALENVLCSFGVRALPVFFTVTVVVAVVVIVMICIP